MSSAFFNKSKNIANDFIQNIVFLDDRAYSRDNEHGQGNVNDLDAPEISKIFAKEKKLLFFQSEVSIHLHSMINPGLNFRFFQKYLQD